MSRAFLRDDVDAAPATGLGDRRAPVMQLIWTLSLAEYDEPVVTRYRVNR